MPDPVETDEPVSLDRAKLNSRADGDAEDDLFKGWIKAARRWIENRYGLVLVRREVAETFDGFRRLRLRAWPIDPGTPVTLTYLGANGIEQTVGTAGYRLAIKGRQAELLPAAGCFWPRTADVSDAVRATFVAGWLPGEVPEEVQLAILLLVDSLYVERDMTPAAVAGVKLLLDDYRRRGV